MKCKDYGTAPAATEPRLNDLLDILHRIIDVVDSYEGQGPLLSCQGQAMDGYSALANFVSIARDARELIVQRQGHMDRTEGMR